MPVSKQTLQVTSTEQTRRNLEARLSREQCEIVRHIRALRATFGPIAKDSGSMLRELDDAGSTDAA
jgi:hypothetical protein